MAAPQQKVPADAQVQIDAKAAVAESIREAETKLLTGDGYCLDLWQTL